MPFKQKEETPLAGLPLQCYLRLYCVNRASRYANSAINARRFVDYINAVPRGYSVNRASRLTHAAIDAVIVDFIRHFVSNLLYILSNFILYYILSLVKIKFTTFLFEE